MKDLLEKIILEFGSDAEEIIAHIMCGESIDNAIQSVVCND